ncbi:hypothetical protein ASPTUDRAFT_51883 [Aspergillus tubingensis CBS 134.48]|uniref:Fumarylacetoacetase-like C-terminal domain-containing protein n=1 Tax=Aspergillus tubingensis (strain CBS 134.48) TaxID=767770 RepID=A0A1L9NL53_ASPTC|nr:hypothetical protein ASPTUDRAFT_51883 [Aspergillus tubingensis CBS 134.48]
MSTFEYLVRFSVGDQTYYGELINTDGNKYTMQQLDVSLLTLSTPLGICLRLNYKGHAKEASDAKKVSTKNALDYVLGYTAGNNLSGRKFQLPEASGDQLSYAKSFDQFAPIGRVLITSQEVQGPQQMSRTNIIDMIWGVLEITVHLSSGIILRKVTVFIIDTPSGLFPEDVARVKNTAKYLQPGPVYDSYIPFDSII